jgi:hypothetical protein
MRHTFARRRRGTVVGLVAATALLAFGVAATTQSPVRADVCAILIVGNGTTTSTSECQPGPNPLPYRCQDLGQLSAGTGAILRLCGPITPPAAGIGAATLAGSGSPS